MVLPLILIMSGTILPKPCTFLQTINKFANVIILVCPKVFPITAHFIKRERALVNIPAKVFEAPCSFLNANVRVFFRWVVNIRLAKIVLRVMDNFCLRQKFMETTWGILQRLGFWGVLERLGFCCVLLPVWYDYFLVKVRVFLDTDLQRSQMVTGLIFWRDKQCAKPFFAEKGLDSADVKIVISPCHKRSV
jgi:hypothetical protein